MLYYLSMELRIKYKYLILLSTVLCFVQFSAWSEDYSPAFKVEQNRTVTKTDLEQNIQRDVAQLFSIFQTKEAVVQLDKKIIHDQKQKPISNAKKNLLL